VEQTIEKKTDSKEKLGRVDPMDDSSQEDEDDDEDPFDVLF